ncbi:MAG: hypothetical protein WCL32_07275 [Planctomycetota bacterium]
MLHEFDDLDRLRNSQHLLVLLSRYADLGKENRSIWQPRLKEMDGLDPSQMSKLHGELLAFEWIELNTGHIPTSYRITPSGVRAVRQLQGVEHPVEIPGPQEEPAPKFPRKKREKVAMAEVFVASE